MGERPDRPQDLSAIEIDAVGPELRRAVVAALAGLRSCSQRLGWTGSGVSPCSWSTGTHHEL